MIDCIRGAYGDTGKVDLPLIDGAPSPDMPDTLCRLLELRGNDGRDVNGGGLAWSAVVLRFKNEFASCNVEGGVVDR